MHTETRLAYVSFDTVPAPKGAATHIEAFVRALDRAFGGVELVTVAGNGQSSHTELPAIGASLIDRVLCFRQYLTRWLATREFDVIQFRSIFEGLPITQMRGRSRLIFEVNGLPSIELKYHYPRMVDDRELMRKIVAQEQVCLEAADLIVTPSGVTREYLISSRGAVREKVRVIPNGVDPLVFQSAARVERNGSMRLLYFGTLAAWQGIELGIRALAQIRAEMEASLTIIGAGSERQREALAGLAAKLGIAGHVKILSPVSQAELAAHLRASDAVLVPLALNDRNVVQGCCPLKILEAMAASVPVIASDLPVVRELGSDGIHFLLVKAGSVDEITRAALRLWSDRSLASRVGEAARTHVETHYTWERSCAALVDAYEELGIRRLSIV